MSTVVLPITELETSETPPPDYRYSLEDDACFADLASTDDIECALAKLRAEQDREQQERPSSILDIASTAMRMPTIAADAAMSLSTSSTLAPVGKADAGSTAMRRPTLTDVAMSVVKAPVSVAVGTGTALQDVALNVSKTGASVAGMTGRMLGSVVHRASIVMAPSGDKASCIAPEIAEELATTDVTEESASFKEEALDATESSAEEPPPPDASEGKQNDGSNKTEGPREIPDKDDEEKSDDSTSEVPVSDDSTSKASSAWSQHHPHEHQETNQRQKRRSSKTLSKQKTSKQHHSRSLSPPVGNQLTCAPKKAKRKSLNGSRSLTPPLLKRCSTTSDVAKIKGLDYYDWAKQAGSEERFDLLVDEDSDEEKETKVRLKRNTSESALRSSRHRNFKDIKRRSQTNWQHHDGDQTFLKAKRDLNLAKEYLERSSSLDATTENGNAGRLHPSNFTGSGSKGPSSLGAKQMLPLAPSSGSRHVRRKTMRRATSLQEVPERSTNLQPLMGINLGVVKENANYDWTASQGMSTKKKGREGRLGKPVCRIGRCKSDSDGQKRTKHHLPPGGDPCKMWVNKTAPESLVVGSGNKEHLNDDVPVSRADIANLVDLVKSLQKEVVELRQEMKELKSERELSGSGGSTSIRRKQNSEMDLSGSGRSTSHRRKHLKYKSALVELVEHEVSGHNRSAPPYARAKQPKMEDSDVDEEDDVISLSEFDD